MRAWYVSRSARQCASRTQDCQTKNATRSAIGPALEKSDAQSVSATAAKLVETIASEVGCTPVLYNLRCDTFDGEPPRQLCTQRDLGGLFFARLDAGGAD